MGREASVAYIRCELRRGAWHLAPVVAGWGVTAWKESTTGYLHRARTRSAWDDASCCCVNASSHSVGASGSRVNVYGHCVRVCRAGPSVCYVCLNTYGDCVKPCSACVSVCRVCVNVCVRRVRACDVC